MEYSTAKRMQSRSPTRIFFRGSIGAKSDCPEGLGRRDVVASDFETGRLIATMAISRTSVIGCLLSLLGARYVLGVYIYCQGNTKEQFRGTRVCIWKIRGRPRQARRSEDDPF